MRSLLIASLILLAGCDPVVGLDVTVVVPPEAQAAFAGTYPAQVAIDYIGPGAEAEPNPTPLGVICAAGSEAQTLTDSMSYVGCADQTEIRAWLLPVPAGSDIDCTTTPPTVKKLSLDPITEAPWATAIAFEGLHDECASVEDAVTLTLQAPAAP